ncbi:FAD binding domain protein [Corynespora cassiicola Philippines]|uniref:FAD binding domain protein n=1 Tax=Corynespora cassiicola Philippines TaxID=1448308 RepID=A0A2T2N8N7_CORCC|nr:FAD binding domain protein [Corynespora cassiicola Philippines]
MNTIQKVIVIGGGPAGLAAALRLQQNNHVSCAVYETRHEPTTLGGAIGIPSNGLRLLNRLGLYENIAARGANTSNIVMHSLKGSVMGSMDITSWSQKQTGFGYLRVRRTDIMDVLLEAARSAAIPIHYSKQVAGIGEDDNHITVSFSDGTSATADFVLGCDGIHSAVRKIYVDPDCKPTYSGISNIYSLISTSKLKPAASSLSDLNATLTSDGLLAVSPATPASDLLYWFFSREIAIPTTGDTRDGWEERGKKEVDSLKAILYELLGDSESEWTGMLRDMIHQTDAMRFYPIYKVPTGRPWYKGRCLIIGDAAHAMPPHASQGVSMALEDVFLFSKLLDTGHSSIQEALKAYEQKRKARTEQMLKTAEQNGGVRKKATPWGLWAKEIAIMGGLWALKATGLEKLGMGQKPLVYNIEEEEFKF